MLAGENHGTFDRERVPGKTRRRPESQPAPSQQSDSNVSAGLRSSSATSKRTAVPCLDFSQAIPYRPPQQDISPLWPSVSMETVDTQTEHNKHETLPVVAFLGSPHTARSQGNWDPDDMTWKSSSSRGGSARDVGEDVLRKRRPATSHHMGVDELNWQQLEGRLEEAERAVLAVVEAQKRSGNGEVTHERGRGRTEPRQTGQTEAREPNTFWERAVAFAGHEVGTSPLRSASPSDEFQRERNQRLSEASKAHLKIQQALDQATLHRRVEELGARVEEEGRLRREAEAARVEAECRLIEFQRLILDETRKGSALWNCLTNQQTHINSSPISGVQSSLAQSRSTSESTLPPLGSLVLPVAEERELASNRVQSPSRPAGADEAGGGSNELEVIECRKVAVLQRSSPSFTLTCGRPQTHENSLFPAAEAICSRSTKSARKSGTTLSRQESLSSFGKEDRAGHSRAIVDAQDSPSRWAESCSSSMYDISFDSSSELASTKSEHGKDPLLRKHRSLEAFPSIPPSTLRTLNSAQSSAPGNPGRAYPDRAHSPVISTMRQSMQPRVPSPPESLIHTQPRFHTIVQPPESFRVSTPSTSRAHTPHTPSPSVSPGLEPTQSRARLSSNHSQTPRDFSLEAPGRTSSRQHSSRQSGPHSPAPSAHSPAPHANARSPSRSQGPSFSRRSALRTPSPEGYPCQMSSRQHAKAPCSKPKLWPHSMARVPSPISARLRSSRCRTSQGSREGL